MESTDTKSSKSRMVQGLVRRILLASAVIAGASCADHKPAQRSPETSSSGYDPYTTTSARTAEAPPPATDPSGPTPPVAPGDEAVPMQDAGAPPPIGGGDGGLGGGISDGGAPRGNPRDGGVGSF